MTPLRRRRPGRRLSGALVLTLPAVALLCVGGCSRGPAALPVPVPRPPAGQATVCAALHRELPDKVAGLDRRPLSPSSPLTAAWGSGDTSVVLRCGIPRPRAMVEQQTGVEADGVSWLAQRPSTGWVFTTTYREAYVQVSLGSGFQDGTLIADFAHAVKKTDPSTT